MENAQTGQSALQPCSDSSNEGGSLSKTTPEVTGLKVKVVQSCPTLWDPMDYIFRVILQARIVQWVAFPFSRGSSLTQRSNPGLPYCRWILYQLSHKGSPRILEWVAYPFSRGSSLPRDQAGVSCTAGRFFTNWVIREAHRGINRYSGTRKRDRVKSVGWSRGVTRGVEPGRGETSTETWGGPLGWLDVGCRSDQAKEGTIRFTAGRQHIVCRGQNTGMDGKNKQHAETRTERSQVLPGVGIWFRRTTGHEHFWGNIFWGKATVRSTL